MSELEKKFKEFLIKHIQVSDSTMTKGEAKALAHDLAEIAEKYYVNCDECMKLCGENAELKKQIECEIANNSLTLERLAITEEEYEEEIKELKKKIEDIPTEEKIIEVLENHFGSMTSDGHSIINKIASEIIEDNK